MNYNHHLPRLMRSIWLTIAVFIAFIVTFVCYVYAEKQIDRANDFRMQTHLQIDEIRISLEDLTNSLRSYVITGDPFYKQHYQEILNKSQDGKPKPSNYYGFYWSLILSDANASKVNSPQSSALTDFIQQMRFTSNELSKFNQAIINTQALINLQASAIHILESSSTPNDANRLTASHMLYDTNYHQHQAAVLLAISELSDMVAQRSQQIVDDNITTALILRCLFITFSILLVLILWRIYREIVAILGGHFEELHQHIVRIGSGDFSVNIPVKQQFANSIMAWLSETQQKLAQQDAKNKQAEATNIRLTKLYAALSQCNQAIVRSTNQEQLFQQICKNAVIYGGMQMAWIGILNTEDNRIINAASYGNGKEYLDEILISINDHEAIGQGPTGIAMRNDQAYWCQDFQHDPVTLAWHEPAAKYGWGSSCSLPLHRNGQIIGAFGLYSGEVNAFDEAIRDLLLEMTMDIDFALNNFQQEQQRIQAELALAESHNLLKTIIDTAPIRVFWKDEHLRYLGCNPPFLKDAGIETLQDIIGKNDYQLAWKECAELYRSDDQQVMNSGIAKLFYEQLQTTCDGKNLWLRISKIPLRNQENTVIGILGIYEDITEQKRTEEHINYLANFDPLTDLPNRNNLNDHLNYALSLAKRSNGLLALMFLDLDHFKDINDTLGHTVGDYLLTELAQRLKLVLREEDTATRLGGDEFIFLFPGTDAKGAAYVAQKLLDIIVKPFKLNDYQLTLTASIGIALYPKDGTDLETLSKCADLAMYKAKHDGRHSFRFFTPEMQTKTARNMQLVSALRLALEQNQLAVYYQPQVDICSGNIIGAEALLRWQHPELGMISPSEFIPIAEESGLILPLGEWVLRTAIKQLKNWQNAGLEQLILAVNLSIVQFRHPDLPKLITAILDQEQLSPENLELELTEGVAMDNPHNVINAMNTLHDCGIRMSIDDFGTGYSSLNYLKKFKVYKLKIDQSFIRDITSNSEDKAIVNAIINVAKSLGMKTIAEGVENTEQLAYLAGQGCDEMQGYLLSKPISAEQFEVFLSSKI